PRFSSRRRQSLFQDCERLCVLALPRQDPPQIAEGGCERAIVAARRRHHLSKLGFCAFEFTPRFKLPPELAADEQGALTRMGELAMKLLGGVEVFEVERRREQRPERVLAILRADQRQRLLVVTPRLGGV